MGVQHYPQWLEAAECKFTVVWVSSSQTVRMNIY